MRHHFPHPLVSSFHLGRADFDYVDQDHNVIQVEGNGLDSSMIYLFPDINASTQTWNLQNLCINIPWVWIFCRNVESVIISKYDTKSLNCFYSICTECNIQIRQTMLHEVFKRRKSCPLYSCFPLFSVMEAIEICAWLALVLPHSR